jgi:hypothetical protein
MNDLHAGPDGLGGCNNPDGLGGDSGPDGLGGDGGPDGLGSDGPHSLGGDGSPDGLGGEGSDGLGGDGLDEQGFIFSMCVTPPPLPVQKNHIALLITFKKNFFFFKLRNQQNIS